MAKKEERGFLDIDLNRLEEEWIGQPILYLKWAEDLADALRDADQTKINLDVTRAEVDLRIRQDPTKYRIPEGKATEAAIKSRILKHAKVIEGQKKVLDAAHRVRILQAAVTALEHRKRALTKEADLFAAKY